MNSVKTLNTPPEEFRIVMASSADREEVLALYALQKGREFCPWTEAYPAPENFEDDVARNALFVMRVPAGEIVGAVSIESDPDVDVLPCWNPALRPAGEISRLAVHPQYQNRGLARKLMGFIMEELSRRGYRSIHLLVNSRNVKALRSYAVFRFDTVGECDMYGQHFLCYEKNLGNPGN